MSAEPFAFLGRAFRPFFLAASVHAAAMIPWWVLTWLGVTSTPSWVDPMAWHAHEMLFGFVAAAIAGFLLTAAPVWSGGPALVGAPLLALFALWLAGRIAFVFAGWLPLGLVAALDVAFLPAVALAAFRTLRGSGQWRNHALVGIVLALAFANAATHAEALGLASGAATRALRSSVDVVVVLILVIGGRLTPAFTRNTFRSAGIERTIRSRPALEAIAIGTTAALAVTRLTIGHGVPSGVLATIAGCATLGRLLGWQSWQTRSDPLLWSLHAGAAWIAVGLLLVGASDLGGPVPPGAGLHSLTIGSIAGTILAVMTRVGLGHTGRALELPRGVVWCFVLLHGAAIARVSAFFAPSALYPALLWTSGLAWSGAFLLFAIAYRSILIRPRPDGKPG